MAYALVSGIVVIPLLHIGVRLGLFDRTIPNIALVAYVFLFLVLAIVTEYVHEEEQKCACGNRTRERVIFRADKIEVVRYCRRCGER